VIFAKPFAYEAHQGLYPGIQSQVAVADAPELQSGQRDLRQNMHQFRIALHYAQMGDTDASTGAHQGDVQWHVVGAKHDRLPAFAPCHFEGYRVTFNELVEAIQAANGRPVKVRSFPWWAVSLLAPLIPFLRELREMRYLWNQEVNLNGTCLHDALDGEVPNTPLPEALAAAGII
jgi:hypothetical protein